MCVFLRYYDHDLYPGFSGIALSLDNGDNWEVLTDQFSHKLLKELKAKYPEAEVVRTPLRDESF